MIASDGRHCVLSGDDEQITIDCISLLVEMLERFPLPDVKAMLYAAYRVKNEKWTKETEKVDTTVTIFGYGRKG